MQERLEESTGCSLCGANHPRRLYRVFDGDISKCRTCGMVYAGPMRLTREGMQARYSTAYFQDEYLPAYGITEDRAEPPACDVRYARLLWLISPYRQRGHLLDIGCGAGFFLKAAERDGWQVTGTEIMDAAVAFARERLGLNVRRAAVEDSDLPEGAYDVVAMFEVLEHVFDPVAALRQARRLLRPGGRLALSTPNISSLSRLALGAQWAVLNPGEHLHYFNKATLTSALRRAGYDDVRFDLHYAGLGVANTMSPDHSYDPESRRVRTYKWLVDTFGNVLRAPVQTLGLADGLHCLARNPE